ncbi:MAG: autotransporter outer membrane beta-barrel domain-containing protein [Comamonadaceae bacterium]|nr:MAG: autotransporter outer membrane beta-barrel domain-containing protein [Comamonadaceae bacterium]
MLITGGGVINNTGQVLGGAGGAGGDSAYFAGAGGDGGDGVVMTQGGVLINSGEVRGGNGGDAGFTDWPRAIPLRVAGQGGVGVNFTGNNGRIVNGGVIAGGLSGAGVQADAIRMVGSNNTLELNVGFSIVGNVVASGAANALTLGGAGSGSFDVASIGAAAQYRGFSQFNKTGTSTWILTGGTTETTPWILAGGVLRTTESINSARAINLVSAGGGFDTVAGTTLRLSGTMSGGAAWSKTGAGTLVLNGANDTTGRTTISAGTLQVDAGFTFGSLGTGGVTNDASLVFNRSNTLVVNNVISGSGAVTQAGTGTTVLTGANTYTGPTTISAGTLQVGNGGTSGSLGTGAVTNNAALVFNRGNLLVVNNAIGGTGAVTQAGTDVTVLTGTNTYTGPTTVSVGTLQIGNGGTTGSLGSGAVMNNSNLVFNRSNTLVVGNAISGTGPLTHAGAGTLVLTGNNTYTSATTIAAGTLQLGDGGTTGTAGLAGAIINNGALVFNRSNDLFVSNGISGTGTVTQAGTGTTAITSDSSYSGLTTISAGTLQIGIPGKAGSLGTGAVINNAALVFNRGGTVVVSGAISGTGTVTQMGTGTTVLNGISTYTGDTTVSNGTLRATGNGIEVIGTTGGASILGGAFTLAGGHVDAGAFEYRLNLTAGGGYLSNLAPPPVDPTVPVTPVDPTVPVTPGGPTAPVTPGGPNVPPVLIPGVIPVAANLPLYRAEVPLFAALPEQLRQGNLAMLGNLHQRMGDDDVKTGNAPSGTGERRAWGRVLSTNLEVQQQGTVSPTSHGRLTGLQAGTDLFATANANANANWRAGVYVGRLDGDMQVSGFARGIANLGVGSNSLSSEYLGAYATYATDSGFYADAVLQGGRHRYDASPGGTYFASHGKATSALASIEVGQAFPLAGSWTIEPQLQFLHQRLNLDDVALSGATVQQDGNGRSLLRAGLRIKGEIATGAGALQPYARVNVYRSAGGTDIANFVGPAATTAIATRTGGTSTELAAGATLALNDRVSLYGELGKLWASGGSAKVGSSVQGSLGARFKW